MFIIALLVDLSIGKFLKKEIGEPISNNYKYFKFLK